MFSRTQPTARQIDWNKCPQHLSRIGFFCSLLLVAGINHGFGAIIQLREEKLVTTNSVVTLGDIAEIHESNPQRTATLQQVIVAPAPAPGRQTLIEHQQIRSRLQAVGVNLAEIEFSGPSQIWVNSGTEQPHHPTNIPLTQQQRIKQLVEQAIGKSLEQNYPQVGRFQVTAALNEDQVRTLNQANADQLRVTGGVPPFTTQQTYLVQYTDSERRTSVLQVVGSAEISPRILAVLHPIEKGHVIQVADLGWRNATNQELKKLSVTQPEQVLGREATRPLAMAEAITPENVRVVPLVATGDIITVYSRRGGISVRMDLRALGTAGLGEMISVQGTDNRTRLQVRVTGYHEAEIATESTEVGNGTRIGFVSGSTPNAATQLSNPSTGGYAR